MGLGLWLLAWTAGFQAADSGQLSLDQAGQWLQEATTQLEGLPADAAADTPEARRRATLERRVALLQEYVKLTEDAAGFTGPWPAFDQRLEEARAGLEQLADETGEEVAAAPESTTEEEFKTLTDELGLQRDQVAQIRKEQADAQQRLDAIPAQIAEARTRAEEARKRGEIQTQGAGSATDEAEQQILSLRASNAAIDRQVALQKVKTLEAEQRFRQAQLPVLQAQLRLAEARLSRIDKVFAAYSEVRESELAREAAQMEGALEQAKQDAETARTPQEQFISSWQFLIAESKASKGRLETLKVNLSRDVEEQVRRRDNDREELAALRDFIARSEGAPQAVERVRETFKQLPQRRAALKRAGETGSMARADELRARRFAVEDALFGLAGRFNEERQVVLDQLGESGQEAFKQETAGLADEHRTALQDEKVLLTEAIGLTTKLELALTERHTTLDDLERFIRSALAARRRSDRRRAAPRRRDRAPDDSGLGQRGRGRRDARRHCPGRHKRDRGRRAPGDGRASGDHRGGAAAPASRREAAQRAGRLCRCDLRRAGRGHAAGAGARHAAAALLPAGRAADRVRESSRRDRTRAAAGLRTRGMVRVHRPAGPLAVRLAGDRRHPVRHGCPGVAVAPPHAPGRRVRVRRLGWLIAAMGVGLGFGLQEIVSNFVSGIILLIERPVRVGDTVTVGNVSGTVTRINIRATSIQNFDRREVLLPNRSLITGEVTNWTRGDSINRLVVSIGVAYGSDVQQVSDLLLEIAEADSDVLDDPAPSVIFMNHGESSLDFDLRVFVSPSVMMSLRDRLNKEINRRFAEAGIEIPFPQRDLHIRSMPVEIPALSVQAER